MKMCTRILIGLALLGTASCVAGTYPDDDGYRHNPRYDEYRGYPDYYWYNRPDYGYHRDHEHEEN
jgi:hypothetical protein